MIIAIDFDGTLDKDPELWLQFILNAKARGHKIFCVTARRDTEENNEIVDSWLKEHGIDIPVFYTGLQSKVGYMESRGFRIDIWIDDDPRSCAIGH